MQQTKVTDNNYDDFYSKVYPVALLDKDRLIDLEKCQGTKIIFDSAGWCYQKHFPNEHILKIEDVFMIKQFKLDNSKFDIIFTDTSFPNIDDPCSTLILDHPRVLKYKSVVETKDFLIKLTDSINSDTVIIRSSLKTTGDFRFTNRLQNLIDIVPEKFIPCFLQYDTLTFTLHLRKIKNYDFN